MAIVALTAIEFVSAAPEVTDITAKQRYPWNGLVDISCKVSGIEADTGGYEFSVTAVNKETGKEYTVSNYSVKHGGEDVMFTRTAIMISCGMHGKSWGRSSLSV